jgi:hypothetical protein
VIETPTVARAIDLAARHWPGEPRSELLLRLVDIGCAALDRRQEVDFDAHRAAVTAGSNAYPDVFGPEYLANLRGDWPA